MYRLQRELIPGVVLLKMITALTACRRLERVVLHQENWGRSNEDVALCNCLLHMIFTLEHFTLLCVIYPVADSIVRAIQEAVRTKNALLRPAFWFFIGSSLPRGGSLNIPRVHLDEIILPVSYFVTPPKNVMLNAVT